MKTLQFTKEIEATAQKVWDVLWNPGTYSKWTSAFNADDPEGGSMQTDWQVGGKTLFLSGSGNGMVATIKSIDEPYELVFEHLGEMIDGGEDAMSERVKAWAGSLEEYYLTEWNGVTTLRTSVQIPEGDDGEEIMDRGFTEGLEEVKRLAEQ
ncbi:SRPBCC family protein [Parapedobacter sp. 10938]|uniref:SRPBCC family protein n=1 Tax=Parapedobacter flavus TaxID=3110225 RepID=UPI002DC04E6C|nr:SRPBCC domain-containing protein [Parapedobacter sp. 10938]MEC3879069.1 SRPBCC domain-containing protein [Parapedobacter sp. 10938]